MTVPCWWLALLIATPVLAQDPAPPKLSVRIIASATDLEFGEPFSLTVERTWPQDLSPEPWDDQQLAPLAVQLLDVASSRQDGVVAESRHYRAFAFSAGELTVTAPYLRAGHGGNRRVAIGDDLHLFVHSSLPDDDNGTIELPRGLYPADQDWLPWSASLLAALVAASGLWWHRRRTTPPPVPVPPATPAAIALAKLAELRRASPRSPVELHADAVAASGLLRQYLGSRSGLDPDELTTDELVAELRASETVSAAEMAAFGQLLGELDLIKFARHTPSVGERAERIDRLADSVCDRPAREERQP